MQNILIIIGIAILIAITGYGIKEKNIGNIFQQQNVSEEKSGTVSGNALSFEGQGLTKVPMNIFDRTSITELNLSHNALEGSLPAEVRHLQNLTVLDLSYNKFTGVPAEVGQLKNLRTLNLSHNNLTGLPNELGNLSNLRLLDLSGNNYSAMDLASIRSRLPASTVIKTQ